MNEPWSAKISQEGMDLLMLEAAISQEYDENEAAFEKLLAAIISDDEEINELGRRVHQIVLRREGRRAMAMNLMARQTALEDLKRKLGG